MVHRKMVVTLSNIQLPPTLITWQHIGGLSVTPKSLCSLFCTISRAEESSSASSIRRRKRGRRKIKIQQYFMWAELLFAALLLCVVPTSSSNLFSSSSSDNDVAKESRIIGGSHVSAM